MPVSSTPYIYEVHGRGSHPLEKSGLVNYELSGRLADSGTVRDRTFISQNSAPQSSGKPGSHGQLDQELTNAQPVDFLSRNRTGLCGHDGSFIDTARAVFDT